MSQIDVLKNEIAGDPEGIGYAGMSDEEVVESLNTENRPVALRPDQGSLFNYVGFNTSIDHSDEDTETFIYGRLTRAAGAAIGSKVFHPNGSVLTAQSKDACITLLAAIDQRRSETITDEQTPAAVALLQAVRAAGVMADKDVSELQKLFQGMVSRAEELGLSRVRAGTIAEARSAK